MGKKSKLSPEMEQLIAENTALKEQNEILGELADTYNQELTETSILLEQTGNKLDEVTTRYEQVMKMLGTGEADNDKIDAI